MGQAYLKYKNKSINCKVPKSALTLLQSMLISIILFCLITGSSMSVAERAIAQESKTADIKKTGALKEAAEKKTGSNNEPRAIKEKSKERADLSKSAKNKSVTKQVKRQERLIPPPPPLLPTLTGAELNGANNLILLGSSIDYLPLSDLEELKQSTEKELDKARKENSDLLAANTEKAQRAETFGRLFAEGVVSKRELESCKKESEKAALELAESENQIQTAESKLKRIEKRLTQLKAKSKDQKKKN